MRFFMISGGGDGLGLLFRLKLEGHETACWIRDRRSKADYDGLLLKKERWEDWITSDTIVIFDSVGGGRTADRLKAAGHFVLCGSSFADQLEIDRHVAKEIVQAAGVKVPRTETFYDWPTGRKYAESREDTRLCFKPSGQMSGVHSYLAYDSRDMVEMLTHFSEKSKGEVEYELQDFVRGVEVSTEGWFNGHEFMLPFNHTIERKQLMNDNLGPSGGCAGNVVWNMTKGVDRVVDEGVSLMAPALRYNNYLGPFDFNTIVNEEGVWWLENTPRFGYDAMPAFIQTLDQPLGEFFSTLAREEHPTHILVKEGFGAALRLTVPPYPTEKMAAEGGLPVRGWKASDRPNLYLYNVALSDKAQLVTSAAYGNVVALTSFATTIYDAMEACQALAKKALIPDKQYRTDLASLFLQQYYELDRVLGQRPDSPTSDVSNPQFSTADVAKA